MPQHRSPSGIKKKRKTAHQASHTEYIFHFVAWLSGAFVAWRVTTPPFLPSLFPSQWKSSRRKSIFMTLPGLFALIKTSKQCSLCEEQWAHLNGAMESPELIAWLGGRECSSPEADLIHRLLPIPSLKVGDGWRIGSPGCSASTCIHESASMIGVAALLSEHLLLFLFFTNC